MRTRNCRAVLSAVLTLAAVALPAAAADVANGERLAQRWCVSCHLATPAQRGPAGEAPPFAEIATKPDIDAAAVALYLLTPHPRMPDMSLSRGEAADLAAYIVGLRR